MRWIKLETNIFQKRMGNEYRVGIQVEEENKKKIYIVVFWKSRHRVFFFKSKNVLLCTIIQIDLSQKRKMRNCWKLPFSQGSQVGCLTH